MSVIVRYCVAPQAGKPVAVRDVAFGTKAEALAFIDGGGPTPGHEAKSIRRLPAHGGRMYSVTFGPSKKA